MKAVTLLMSVLSSADSKLSAVTLLMSVLASADSTECGYTVDTQNYELWKDKRTNSMHCGKIQAKSCILSLPTMYHAEGLE